MKTTTTVGRKAISYIRFSSLKQEEGFSLARQLEGTKGFCSRHNLFLDESLTVKDLGLSAFRGKNADSGNLGVFLAAVRENKIPKGTVLVVEALDRLTRNNIVEASHLLTDILRQGIDVGLVTEDKVYSYDYINKNPFEFIVATTYLIRGGDESRMKSERIKDAWSRKKRCIVETKEAVKIPAPCWLKREGQKWSVISKKAKVVKEIFAAYLKESLGIWRLSQTMNSQKVPVITNGATPASKWHRITLHRILTDKAVIGTYTKLDEPVENYFPAIIPQKDFYAVQAKLQERRHYRGRHSLKDVSLLKGICKCGKCGSTMTRITRTRKIKGGGSKLYRYLYCHNSILGLCKPATSVDLNELERIFLHYMFTSETALTFLSECKADDSIQTELRTIDGQIEDKAARRDRLIAVIESDAAATPSSVLERIASLEQEIKMLRVKKDSLTATLNRNPQGEAALNDLFVTAEKVLKNKPADRLRLRELIRQFVRSMTVYPEHRKAIFTTIAGKTREMTWNKRPRDPVTNGKPVPFYMRTYKNS
ncbi:recombinase family protein [Pedosphaera parvula]|nr:recombinase family protein [Pedosphaera parvula]